jgi:hypothetical protein
MNNTSTMIQDDKIKAKSILKQIKGCKVADDNNQYEVVNVKCFNGQVSSIGLKDIPTGFIKYATLDCYMEMASIA